MEFLGKYYLSLSLNCTVPTCMDCTGYPRRSGSMCSTQREGQNILSKRWVKLRRKERTNQDARWDASVGGSASSCAASWQSFQSSFRSRQGSSEKAEVELAASTLFQRWSRGSRDREPPKHRITSYKQSLRGDAETSLSPSEYGLSKVFPVSTVCLKYTKPGIIK